ncbi:hypothetical protein E4U54_004773 [Claviceps lovelessii]|nr:hypothetical protein E4U54_004773 [Claviceps lovelessii]
MGLKERISSPLEAGPSLLDSHHLPPHLTPALEYASVRLAKKSAHLTLVVVRRQYHVPTAPVLPPQSSTSCSFYPASSAASSSATSSSSSSSASLSSSLSKLSLATGSVTALKQLVRSGSCRQGVAGPRARNNTTRKTSMATKTTRTINTTTTTTAAPAANSSLDSPGLAHRWPLSPTTAPLPSPKPVTSTSCTSSSVATSTTTDHLASSSPGGATALLFLHAPDLSPRDQKIQRVVFTKTAHKFNVSPLLHPAVSPSIYGLSSQLFTNSVIQHDVLFSSDGLTILSLDRLYSLKAALASYTRHKSPQRLEDAVDELRRYVLASHGAKVTRSDLCRAYDWLNVGPGAVADLDGMYRRAYGGPDQVGAIAGVESETVTPPSPPSPPSRLSRLSPPAHSAHPPPPPPIHLDHDNPAVDDYASSFLQDQDVEVLPEHIGLAVTTFSETTTRTPSPAPANQTRPLVLRSKWGYEDDEDDEDDDDDDDDNDNDNDDDDDDEDDDDVKDNASSNSSIHSHHKNTPPPPQLHHPSPPPSTSTVGFVPLQPSFLDDRNLRGAGTASFSPDDNASMPLLGPTTPHAHEDISPITRGEWGFLMAGRGSSRTVKVDTC